MNILESTFWISFIKFDFRLIFQLLTLIRIYPVVTYSPIDLKKKRNVPYMKMSIYVQEKHIYNIYSSNSPKIGVNIWLLFVHYYHNHQYQFSTLTKRGRESLKHCQDLLWKHTILVGDKQVLCLCPTVSADASLSPFVIDHIVVTILLGGTA